jgi:hypothetical protein
LFLESARANIRFIETVFIFFLAKCCELF